MVRSIAIFICMAVLPFADAEARPAEAMTSDQVELNSVLSELHLKWRASPEAVRKLDASQQSWERSVAETCSTLVRTVYDHGSIVGVKEKECSSQAATERAALLRTTFRSSLRN